MIFLRNTIPPNLKTAKALGLTIRGLWFAIADEAIECD